MQPFLIRAGKDVAHGIRTWRREQGRAALPGHPAHPDDPFPRGDRQGSVLLRRNALRRHDRHSLEAAPRHFDLGLASALAARPGLRRGCAVFGDVVANDCAGCAVENTGLFTGKCFRRQSEKHRQHDTATKSHKSRLFFDDNWKSARSRMLHCTRSREGQPRIGRPSHASVSCYGFRPQTGQPITTQCHRLLFLEHHNTSRQSAGRADVNARPVQRFKSDRISGRFPAAGDVTPGPVPDHRIDKAVAGVGMALPARLQNMAKQEHSRQLKAVP